MNDDPIKTSGKSKINYRYIVSGVVTIAILIITVILVINYMTAKPAHESEVKVSYELDNAIRRFFNTTEGHEVYGIKAYYCERFIFGDGKETARIRYVIKLEIKTDIFEKDWWRKNRTILLNEEEFKNPPSNFRGVLSQVDPNLKCRIMP